MLQLLCSPASLRLLTTTVRSCPPLATSAAAEEEDGAAAELPAVPGRDKSCSSDTETASQ
jgi:hypothetical protein